MAEVMFDDLENFKDWWLANRLINTPLTNSLICIAETHGVVLYRQDNYQVEMFLVKPNSEIEPHIHPNVDSFEVFIGGTIDFMCNGQWFAQNNIGDAIRVYPNSWHGGKFGDLGGCFLSVQKWLNNVEPKFVGDDWVDTRKTGSYKENREPLHDANSHSVSA
jgi:quercetin dioxygenase-like cupin family protein